MVTVELQGDLFVSAEVAARGEALIRTLVGRQHLRQVEFHRQRIVLDVAPVSARTHRYVVHY